MDTRSLRVLGNAGAGKKTLLGSLIYKCGLGASQLEELEREGIQLYTEIVPFYKKKGRLQCFHSPTGPFVVEVPESRKPDVAFWVVDASDSTSWCSSAQKLADSLASGDLQPQDKLVVLINKMDLVDWSKKTFEDVVSVFNAVELNVRIFILPVSSLKAENILETPQKASWINNLSVSDAPVSRKALMDVIG